MRVTGLTANSREIELTAASRDVAVGRFLGVFLTASARATPGGQWTLTQAGARP